MSLEDLRSGFSAEIQRIRNVQNRYAKEGEEWLTFAAMYRDSGLGLYQKPGSGKERKLLEILQERFRGVDLRLDSSHILINEQIDGAEQIVNGREAALIDGIGNEAEDVIMVAVYGKRKGEKRRGW